MALAALVVAALSLWPRLLLAAGALPEWLAPFTWSDVYATYVLRGLAGGRVPYADAPFEYPPGIGYVAGVISVASGNVAAYVLGWGIVIVVAAGAGAYLLSQHAGAGRTLRYWSLTPQLLLLSGLNFDVLAAAFVALASVVERQRRHGAAMLALALGTVTKLFPASAAPLLALRAWRAGARADAARLGLVFAAVVLAIYLPSLLMPYSSAHGLAYHGYALGANADSVWGLAAGALAAFGVPDPAAVVVFASTVGLVSMYVLGVVPRALRAPDAVVGFGLATVAALLWSRVYSPQYSLWLLPFFVLLPLSARTFALLSIADGGVFLTIYPLSLVRWGPADVLATALLAILAAAVVLRHVALLRVWLELTRLTAAERTPRGR